MPSITGNDGKVYAPGHPDYLRVKVENLEGTARVDHGDGRSTEPLDQAGRLVLGVAGRHLRADARSARLRAATNLASIDRREDDRGVRAPNPVILDNGDVLAPVKRFDGGYEMVRVPVGAAKHATWVAHAQGIQQPVIGAGIGVLVAILLPIVGLVVSVVWLARGRTGAGVAVLVATLVGALLNFALLF
jgi:hypothetical protein